MTSELIESKLADLPTSPGCYLFRDAEGRLLYVGKAKSLRARVRSYFQSGSSDSRAFVPLLRRHAVDLETLVTRSEKEAALLENSLIKEHQPRFNVKLRDDKEFLTLRLGQQHPFPRLELVRRPKADGARYFGPYHSATAARRLLHLVEKHFQLRTCSDRELESRTRPCLQYQIKRCLAPCAFEIDRELYAEQLRSVVLLLEGRYDELQRQLEQRMREASAQLEYERAATYRDNLAALRAVREHQSVEVVGQGDQDVLGLYREGELVELSVLYVRGGRVTDIVSFSSARVELPDDEVVAAFLREHYGDDGPGQGMVPAEVLLPLLPEGAAGVAEWLTDRRRELARARGEAGAGRCSLSVPRRGPRAKLLALATDNARHAFAEKRRAKEDLGERLGRLQERLRLPTLPRRIECVDISHLGGKDGVGAVVALRDGLPDKAHYRTYKLRAVAEGDDYGAIREVLARRFRRGLLARDGAVASVGKSEEADWSLPDLVVVDGGRGQLGVALTAAQDLGLFELPIVGLAKERETVTGDKLVDRAYLPGQKNPIALRPNSAEWLLLTRVRDEAHRFSNRGRIKAGQARQLRSMLDDVPGIGPKTRTAWLTELGSLEAVLAATDERLLAIAGTRRAQVAALRAAVARGALGCEEASAEPPMGAPDAVPPPSDTPTPLRYLPTK